MSSKAKKVQTRNEIGEEGIKLGELLCQLRKDAGLLQKDVATALGVKAVTISAYEMGRIVPTAEKLYTLAKYYGINAEILLSKIGVTDETYGNTECNSKDVDDKGYQLDEMNYYYTKLPHDQQEAVFNLIKSMYLC